jgi:all-trans-retinol 13,14-reductase
MPEVFDHYCFPDFQVDVPSSPEEYKSHLKSVFPDEHREIDGYFDDLMCFREKLAWVWAPKLLPNPIVKLESGEIIRGKTIISGIGIRSTFTRLLSEQNVPQKIKDILGEYENSVSYAQLYAGLKDDPSSIPGIDGSNYWISSITEFPQNIKELQYAQDDSLDVKSVMLTFPSLKDHDAKFHTLTICAWINYGFFKKWAKTKNLHGPNGYKAMKSKLKEALLRPVLAKFPQLQELIEYTTVGTPLTAEHYMGHAEGSAYGLTSPPGRYNDDRLRPRTVIDGLFLTGSDIASSGVPGAFAAGVFCASVILKKNMATALIKLDKKHYGSESVR